MRQDPQDNKISDLLDYLGFDQRKRLYDPDEPDADPNIFSQSARDGKTLLSYALWNDDYGLVKTLCARVEGLRSDVPNEDRTPNALMIALGKAKCGVEDQALQKLVSLADCENALQDVLKLRHVDLLAKLLHCLKKRNISAVSIARYSKLSSIMQLRILLSLCSGQSSKN
jgi:hypothetical protein